MESGGLKLKKGRIQVDGFFQLRKHRKLARIDHQILMIKTGNFLLELK
jgi:hypothetical protein